MGAAIGSLLGGAGDSIGSLLGGAGDSIGSMLGGDEGIGSMPGGAEDGAKGRAKDLGFDMKSLIENDRERYLKQGTSSPGIVAGPGYVDSSQPMAPQGLMEQMQQMQGNQQPMRRRRQDASGLFDLANRG